MIVSRVDGKSLVYVHTELQEYFRRWFCQGISLVIVLKGAWISPKDTLQGNYFHVHIVSLIPESQTPSYVSRSFSCVLHVLLIILNILKGNKKTRVCSKIVIFSWKQRRYSVSKGRIIKVNLCHYVIKKTLYVTNIR